MDLSLLFDTLRQHRDAEKAQLMAQYMRNQFEFLGIQSPERQRLIKPYLVAAKIQIKQASKQVPSQTPVIDWEFVELCWQAPEREFQLIATDYLKVMQVCLKPEDLVKFEKLIVQKSWWDTVDSLVKTVGYLVQKYPHLVPKIKEWSRAENFWLRRAAILHQLGLKEQTDTERLQEILLNNFGETEFFINKAIGWALREYGKTNPQWVIDFVTTHRNQMSKLSWREATKHLEIQ